MALFIDFVILSIWVFQDNAEWHRLGVAGSIFQVKSHWIGGLWPSLRRYIMNRDGSYTHFLYDVWSFPPWNERKGIGRPIANKREIFTDFTVSGLQLMTKLTVSAWPLKSWGVRSNPPYMPSELTEKFECCFISTMRILSISWTCSPQTPAWTT